MKRIDTILSIVIGFFIGIFCFIILKITEIKIPYSFLLIIIFPPLAFLGMFIASWLGKKFLIILQAAKFVLVGALNSFIDYGVTYFLIWISGIAVGLPFSTFKGVGFLIAAINSYFWNKHWTFQKSKKVFIPGEFYKFLSIVFIGFCLNVGIASLVVNVIGPQFGLSNIIWAGVGMIIATLIAWVWNFFGSKFIVFKK